MWCILYDNSGHLERHPIAKSASQDGCHGEMHCHRLSLFLQVHCQPADSGSVCSLLSQHEAVVTKRGGERGVAGVDSWAEFKDKLDYVINVLE